MQLFSKKNKLYLINAGKQLEKGDFNKLSSEKYQSFHNYVLKRFVLLVRL
jgi:hypothetical protein